MRFRFASTVVVAVVLLAHADAYGWLYIIPKDQLRDPLPCLSGKWFVPPGDVPTPVVGFYVNTCSYYYFQGDAADISQYLARCAEAADYVENEGGWYAHVDRDVVIHAGAGFAKIDSTKDEPNAPRAQWKLGLVNDTNRDAGGRRIRTLNVKVEIWIDETVNARDLEIPKGFEVSLGDELKRMLGVGGIELD